MAMRKICIQTDSGGTTKINCGTHKYAALNIINLLFAEFAKRKLKGYKTVEFFHELD